MTSTKRFSLAVSKAHESSTRSARTASSAQPGVWYTTTSASSSAWRIASGSPEREMSPAAAPPAPPVRRAASVGVVPATLGAVERHMPQTS